MDTEFFPPPPLLSKGLDERPLPIISRSGSGTGYYPDHSERPKQRNQNEPCQKQAFLSEKAFIDTYYLDYCTLFRPNYIQTTHVFDRFPLFPLPYIKLIVTHYPILKISRMANSCPVCFRSFDYCGQTQVKIC